jgi:hypothetical protein
MIWENVLMLVVLILVSYTGIKVINQIFENKKDKKKINSLF